MVKFKKSQCETNAQNQHPVNKNVKICSRSDNDVVWGILEYLILYLLFYSTNSLYYKLVSVVSECIKNLLKSIFLAYF